MKFKFKTFPLIILKSCIIYIPVCVSCIMWSDIEFYYNFLSISLIISLIIFTSNFTLSITNHIKLLSKVIFFSKKLSNKFSSVQKLMITFVPIISLCCISFLSFGILYLQDNGGVDDLYLALFSLPIIIPINLLLLLYVPTFIFLLWGKQNIKN